MMVLKVKSHSLKTCSLFGRGFSTTNILILILTLTLIGNLTILLQILNNLEYQNIDVKVKGKGRLIKEDRKAIIGEDLERNALLHSDLSNKHPHELSNEKEKERKDAVNDNIHPVDAGLDTSSTTTTTTAKTTSRPPPTPTTTTTTTTTTETSEATEITTKIINVEVMSSREEVHVLVDGTTAYRRISKYRNFRGIHVVILNQVDGSVMSTRLFDVYSRFQDEALLDYLHTIKPHRLFIFTVMDEGSFSLGVKARKYVSTFGSRYIQNLKYRDSWTFIAWKTKPIKEGFKANKKGSGSWGETVITSTKIKLLERDDDFCDWPDGYEADEILSKRRTFCQKFDGYAKVCDCKSPKDIDIISPTLSAGSIASELPISVVAGNRPFYLFRMLNGLLSTPGVNRKMVTVYIDGFFKEVAGVAELFGVNYVHHEPICSRNCRISQHYKRTLKETFDKYPSADYMIILEEDLDVSQDLMDYFSQLIPVLSSDDSVYCISAWNDQGYTHSSNDSSMLYRVETMPGLGWVLKRSLWKELEPKWPGSDKFWDWDMWMRMDSNRKGRECIIPDVSRTFHFGAIGLNVDPNFQKDYFSSHELNKKTGIKFDVDKMTKEGYEMEIERIIKDSEVITFNKKKCTRKDEIIPKASHGKVHVMYIKQTRDRDYDTWLNLAHCFKLWDIDVRGFHKQMWRFWFHGNHILIVGSNSPYFKFKPNNTIAVYLPKEKEKS